MALKNTIPAPADGIYVLTNHVTNPGGNYKVKHDFWKIKIWPQGTKLVIESYDEQTLPGVKSIRPVGGYNQLLFHVGNKAKLDAIIPHLRRAEEETLEQILLAGKEVAGISSKHVLVYLIENDCLSLNDIKRAVAALKEKRK